MDMMTAKDIAKRFNVQAAVVYKWRDSGRLPPPIPGPRRRGIVWDKAVIDKWAEDNFPVRKVEE